MATIGSLSVKLGLVTLEWDKATDKAKAQAIALQNQFNSLGNGVKNLSERFNQIAAAGGIVALGALTRNAIQLTDEVDDLSKSFGLSIEEILQFRSALVDAGGKADGAAKILQTMFSKIEDAQSGSDKTVAMFEKLGISLDELKQMQPGEAIQKIADGFGNLSNQFEKTKFIKEFFGKGGIGLTVEELSKALKTNADQFKGTADNIRTVGQVADTLKHNIENLTIAFTNLIAPFSQGGVLSIKEFEGILKGIAAGAITFQVLKMAEALVAVATALRAAAAAGAIFNVTAGGFNPTGLALKVAALGIGYLVYQGASKTKDMGVTADVLEKSDAKDKAEEQAFKDLQAKRKADAEGKAATASKEAEQKRIAVALANAQFDIEKKRYAVEAQSADLGEHATAFKLIELQTAEKILAINAQRKDQLEAQKDGTKELKDKINALADIDVKRAKASEEAQKAAVTREEKLVAIRMKSQSAVSEYLDMAQSNQEYADYVAMTEQAAYQIRQQYDAQLRNEELVKSRLEYEQKIMYQSQDDQKYLLKRYDIEAQITEFKRQQKELGVPESLANTRAEALQKVLDKQLQITEQTELQQRSFTYGWKQAYEQYMYDSTNAARIAGDAFSSIIGNMNSAIDNFVRTGKLSFSDFARSVIRDLWAIQLKAQAAQIFSFAQGGIFKAVKAMMPGGAVSSSSAGLPGSFDMFGSTSAKASGGTVSNNTPYLVGENGPEMFIPGASGTVIPNNNLASSMNNGGQTINYNGPYIANMSAIDTQSGVQFLAKNKQTIWASYQSANRSVPVSR